MRQAFAAREFARLAADLSDDDLGRPQRPPGRTPGSASPPRWARSPAAQDPRPGIPEDDTSSTPTAARRPRTNAPRSSSEPGLVAVERVVRIAFG
jgi:protein-tyrosine phosphatase